MRLLLYQLDSNGPGRFNVHCTLVPRLRGASIYHYMYPISLMKVWEGLEVIVPHTPIGHEVQRLKASLTIEARVFRADWVVDCDPFSRVNVTNAALFASDLVLESLKRIRSPVGLVVPVEHSHLGKDHNVLTIASVAIQIGRPNN